jgi:hypothetical protein
MLKIFKEVRLKLWEMTIKGTSFNNFTNFCVDNDIQYQFTTPTFLKQNGVFEWKNQTLFEVDFSMLHHANL